MKLKDAIEICKNFNDGYTFKECEICSNFNEKDSCCNKKKCDNLKAIEKVLQELEKLQQDNYRLDRENQLMFESQINSIPKEKMEELERQNSIIKKLKDKMIGDRMEQFDDYNVYLINSYLDIIEGEEK